jgi:tol-pal system protein YbgF
MSMKSLVRPGRFLPVLAVLMLLPAPALAQSREDTANRLNRLERDVQTLNQQVFRNGGGTAAAPAAASGEDATGFAASFETRLSGLERQLYDLTGRIERIEHEQRQAKQEREAADRDLEFRLKRLENQAAISDLPMGQPGAIPGASPGLPAPANPAGFDPVPPVSVTSVPAPVASAPPPGAVAQPMPVVSPPAPAPSAEPPPAPSQPGTLGTVTDSDLSRLRPVDPDRSFSLDPSGPQPVPPPETSSASAADIEPTPVQAQYDRAYDLMNAGNFDEAMTGFQTFLSEHGDDPLAENARYWMSEIQYNRGNYREAALGFGQGYQGFPQGNKAADNLLKMGMSLLRLGQKQDACTTFDQLAREFPQAPARIKDVAARERVTAECR